MTAVMMLSVGCMLEYSKSSDKAILMICIFEGFTKIIMSLVLFKVIEIDVENSLMFDFLQTIKDI